MTVNIEVEKHSNENNMGVVRKFTRKVRSAGILNHLKKKRYHERSKSENVRRNKKVKSLQKKEKVERLIKLGKIRPRTPRR